MRSESKMWIKENNSIECAFKQARDYANILESTMISLCDKYRLYAYSKKQSFDRDNYKVYYWEEFKTPAKYNEFKKLIS